jgi:NDP-sugar pyrophosphorylase family protein
MIPALVLTAGLATRLRPLSFVRAKAALPVAGQPLIRRILTYCHASGVTRAVLNLHHLPHTITAAVGDGSDIGLDVRYSWEHPVLGSAGGPKLALPLLGEPAFLIVNGDTLTSADLPALVEAHRRSGALVTLAVTGNPDPDRYGGVLVDAAGRVTGFTRRGSGQPSWHFVGVQVAEADAFRSVPPGTPFESTRQLYPALIADRPGSVRAHVCETEFFDIGTPGDYLQTALLLARREPHASMHGQRVRVDPSARIDDSVLWDDVEVGPGAQLDGSVVTDGVRIPDGSRWSGVALRAAGGDLAPGERQVGDLYVSAL